MLSICNSQSGSIRGNTHTQPVNPDPSRSKPGPRSNVGNVKTTGNVSKVYKPDNTRIIEHVLAGTKSKDDALRCTRALIINCTDISVAFQLVENLVKAGIKPNLYICTALFTVCMNAGRPDKVRDIFTLIETHNIPVNIIMCNAFITAFGKAVQPDKVNDVWAMILNLKIPPDIITCNASITAYGKAGQPKKVDGVRTMMQEFEIPPDIITCGALVTVYGKAGQPDKVDGVLTMMNEQGIPPNLVFCNALITAYRDTGQPDKVDDVWEMIRTYGILPDPITYDASISACMTNPVYFDKAIKFIKEGINAGIIKPDAGYDAEKNTLNFHYSEIFFLHKALQEHEPGVGALVARAIFLHHIKEGNVTKNSTMIVGQNGDDIIKKVISSELSKAFGDVHVVDKKNPGRLVPADSSARGSSVKASASEKTINKKFAETPSDHVAEKAKPINVSEPTRSFAKKSHRFSELNGQEVCKAVAKYKDSDTIKAAPYTRDEFNYAFEKIIAWHNKEIMNIDISEKTSKVNIKKRLTALADLLKNKAPDVIVSELMTKTLVSLVFENYSCNNSSAAERVNQPLMTQVLNVLEQHSSSEIREFMNSARNKYIKETPSESLSHFMENPPKKIDPELAETLNRRDKNEQIKILNQKETENIIKSL